MTVYISFEQMKDEIGRVLMKNGFDAEKAAKCAKIFAQSSLDGVYSHGLYRVPVFVEAINNGYIDPDAEPELVASSGMIEQYDGYLGPGILNASICMDRAIELSKQHGIGFVALRNTNHWMRGGSYGWQAAEAGHIGICWTNTESCMPPWGATQPKIGNNPLVIAVPQKDSPIVLDMAMSQYSTGKIDVTRMNKQQLPFPGGYDQEGRLTHDPEQIQATNRILPAGYWKGSGLAIMLDLLASLLSGGLSTCKIDQKKKDRAVSCNGCSQVFIAIDIHSLSSEHFVSQTVQETIDYLHQAECEENNQVFYPGEKTIRTREENRSKGIPVDEEKWKLLLSM